MRSAAFRVHFRMLDDIEITGFDAPTRRLELRDKIRLNLRRQPLARR